MNVVMFVVVVVGLLAGGPAVSAVGEAAVPQHMERDDLAVAPDHVLVRVEPSSEAMALFDDRTDPVVGEWRTFPVQPGESPETAAERIRALPGVKDVELDPVVHVAQSSDDSGPPPDDPHYSYQWNFQAVQVEEAWAHSTGDGAVVAVIDSGVSLGGTDLDCHTFISPYNAITGSAGVAAARDDHGHGTHVTGTVAQCTHNGTGTAGIAFDAGIMPVKALGPSGSGLMSDVAKGIDWARNHGADVINLSLGCVCKAFGPEDLDFFDDAIEKAVNEGVVLVAAAGNESDPTVLYPARHPDVIAVGATDLGNSKAPYSNYGDSLDLVAPGGDLYEDLNDDGFVDGVLQETHFDCAGWPEGCPPSISGSGGWDFYFLHGTSMATPHVSAAAALLESVDSSLDGGRVAALLASTTRDLGTSGRDDLFGHGLVQIADAFDLLAATDGVPPAWPAGAKLSVEWVTSSAVTLSWPAASDDRAVGGYRIASDGELFRATTQTQVTLEGWEGQSKRIVEVRAVDVAGNLSQPLTVELVAPSDHAPTWSNAADVWVKHFGERTLTLGWRGASDDFAVTGYMLRRQGGPSVMTSSTQATVTGLDPGRAYVFEVLARDASGNWSGPLRTTASTALAFQDTWGDTFYEDILWMSGTGVTKGCNPPANNLFCPDDPVTRGQMAAFLVRALGLKADSHPGFNDVPASSTFAHDIRRLATAGITRGCNPPMNTSFCPDDPVTRGQMAAFLVRALGLTSDLHPGFGDVPKSSTFADDIARLATAGITRGCNPPDNSLFCPEDSVTRGQLAAFLRRGLANG